MPATLWPLLLFPLLGALVCGLTGRRLLARFGPHAVGYVAIAAVGLSALFALITTARLLALPPDNRVLADHLWTLLLIDRFGVDFALLFDPLAATFALVITLVGSAIHVYAATYLHDDAGLPRFFAFLNLFVAAMLLLVLGDSLLLAFFGWEGVGLCSYFLIGHWYREPDNGRAAHKAFIANRIGDWGFVAGMAALLAVLAGVGAPNERVYAGAREVTLGPTLEFRELRAVAEARDAGGQPVAARLQQAELFGLPALAVIGVFFFLAMSGKSAQIPLYLWLPDAMAGPTPVSALIHAATMVTAGVYLGARLDFLYALAPAAAALMAVLGVATALVGAVLATFQQDLKRLLAYSTISQLGFMFLALGVGAPGAAVFHVVTHATFKAALFLAAGAVIHAQAVALGPPVAPPARESRRRTRPDAHDAQDLRHMGGLAAALPRTRLVYLIGALALAGLPIAAGFYSKDEILLRTLSAPGSLATVLFWVALAVAGLTAFYSARGYYLAFAGAPRAARVAEPHEAGPGMVRPMLALAGAALVVGPLFGWPAAWGGHPLLEGFIAPTLHPQAHTAPGYALGLQLLAVVVSVGGWFAGRRLYGDLGVTRARLEAWRTRFDRVHRVLWNRLHADDLARALVVHPAEDFARAASYTDTHLVDGALAVVAWCARAAARAGAWLDRWVVDGVVDGVTRLISVGGRHLQRVQTGRLNHYTLGITLGTAALVVLAWIMR